MLVGLRPTVLVYLVSYLLIVLYWAAHHRMFRYVRRADDVSLWLNIFLLLLSISFTPFPASLLIKYGDLRTVWTMFASVMGTTGVLTTLLWYYATQGHRLVASDLDSRLIRYYRFRALVPPIVFFASIGVLVLQRHGGGVIRHRHILRPASRQVAHLSRVSRVCETALFGLLSGANARLDNLRDGILAVKTLFRLGS